MNKRQWTVPGRVVRIIDGDTLCVDLDLGWGVWKIGEKVRLQGINCPEIDTPEGRKARAFVTGTLMGRASTINPEVTVVSRGFDKYGRVLGSIILPNATDLATELLEAGLAVTMEE